MVTGGGAVADAIHAIARQVRPHTAVLLAGADDPHAELLTLVWGPQFDREYALALWASFSQQQPVEAMPLLPELLSVGARFDALGREDQQRLRRLIVRHGAFATRAEAERVGSRDPVPGRPKPDQPPRGAATRAAAEHGGHDLPVRMNR